MSDDVYRTFHLNPDAYDLLDADFQGKVTEYVKNFKTIFYFVGSLPRYIYDSAWEADVQ